MDHWLEFSSARLGCPGEFVDGLQYLDTVLAPVTFLVGHALSLADIAVWGVLAGLLSASTCTLYANRHNAMYSF